jgi:hypothetical protein
VNVYPTAPKPSYAAPAPVVARKPQPPKAQQQRPASIHGYSSLQSPAPSKPLSPLPLLQTASPQFQSPVHGSPRGWAHVEYSPRSPGAAVNQQPNFYNAAPVAAQFQLTHSTSSLGQPQVRSAVSLPFSRFLFDALNSRKENPQNRSI